PMSNAMMPTRLKTCAPNLLSSDTAGGGGVPGKEGAVTGGGGGATSFPVSNVADPSLTRVSDAFLAGTGAALPWTRADAASRISRSCCPSAFPRAERAAPCAIRFASSPPDSCPRIPSDPMATTVPFRCFHWQRKHRLDTLCAHEYRQDLHPG